MHEVHDCQLYSIFIPAVLVFIESHANYFEILPKGKLTFYTENNSDQTCWILREFHGSLIRLCCTAVPQLLPC